MPVAGTTDVFRLPLPPYTSVGPAGNGWLAALRSYLATTGALDLVWETAQLPPCTLWDEGMVGSKAFAVLHCTAGDILIALSALYGALIAAGDPAWPGRHAGRVKALACWEGSPTPRLASG